MLWESLCLRFFIQNIQPSLQEARGLIHLSEMDEAFETDLCPS